jgi:hypothetical protein
LLRRPSSLSNYYYLSANHDDGVPVRPDLCLGSIPILAFSKQRLPGYRLPVLELYLRARDNGYYHSMSLSLHWIYHNNYYDNNDDYNNRCPMQSSPVRLRLEWAELVPDRTIV